MRDLLRELLVKLGEDPGREGLIETPERMENAYKFLTSGYKADIEKILTSSIFDEKYDEMVVVKDVDFYSLCEHHMLPFFGKCHVAYIPKGKMAWASCFSVSRARKYDWSLTGSTPLSRQGRPVDDLSILA